MNHEAPDFTKYKGLMCTFPTAASLESITVPDGAHVIQKLYVQRDKNLRPRRETCSSFPRYFSREGRKGKLTKDSAMQALKLPVTTASNIFSSTRVELQDPVSQLTFHEIKLLYKNKTKQN